MHTHSHINKFNITCLKNIMHLCQDKHALKDVLGSSKHISTITGITSVSITQKWACTAINVLSSTAALIVAYYFVLATKWGMLNILCILYRYLTCLLLLLSCSRVRFYGIGMIDSSCIDLKITSLLRNKQWKSSTDLSRLLHEIRASFFGTVNRMDLW